MPQRRRVANALSRWTSTTTTSGGTGGEERPASSHPTQVHERRRRKTPVLPIFRPASRPASMALLVGSFVAAAAVIMILLMVVPRGASREEPHQRTIAPRKIEPPKIPRRLMFTYSANLLEEGGRGPRLLVENVNRTISAYRTFWSDPSAPVLFLTDGDCEEAIRSAEPRLLEQFRGESQGMYKADVCRVAAQWLHGGWYFDVDIQVVTPLELSPETDFATAIAKERGEFFQAFVAARPGHPVLRRALDVMLDYYEGRLEIPTDSLMGTYTLRRAFDSVPAEERGVVRLLREKKLRELDRFNPLERLAGRFRKALHYYLDLPRQNGLGCCCNHIVHGPDESVVYFYSRIVGSSNCRPVRGSRASRVSNLRREVEAMNRALDNFSSRNAKHGHPPS